MAVVHLFINSTLTIKKDKMSYFQMILVVVWSSVLVVPVTMMTLTLAKWVESINNQTDDEEIVEDKE
jgi:hypothetical protein